MTSFIHTLALASFLSTLPLAFGSTGGGNGGGGVCTGSRCITLAEAGFRIPMAPEIHDGRYEVPYQLLDELDLIIGLLPKSFQKFRSMDVIGPRESIFMLEVVNDRKTQTFLNQYKRLLSAQGSGLKNSVEILAFTVPSENGDRKTYLIKEKFDALSLRSQALLLIHEYNLRSRYMTLESALVFDGALVDYLQAVETNRPVDSVSLARSMSQIGIISQKELGGYVLNDFLSTGSVHLATDFFSLNVHESEVSFSYENLIRMKKDHPLLAQTLKQQAYKVKYVPRGSFFQSFIDEVADMVRTSPSRTVEITDELFQTIHEKISKRFNADVLSAFDRCGAWVDKSVVLVGSEALDGQPLGIGCKSEVFLSNHGYHFPYQSMSNLLFQNELNGVGVDFSKPVACRMSGTIDSKMVIDCKKAQ